VTNFKTPTQEETHLKVMRLLEVNPDITQRELGLSLDSINYYLKALMDKGLVKMKNFATSKNKYGYVYVLAPSGISEKAIITHRFLKRKIGDYEALKAKIEALENEVCDEALTAVKVDNN
jgi:EPS-associated MarR family transcriptional regulator